MTGLLIIIFGILVAQSWTWSYAFDIGRYESLYKISLGIAILLSISYIIWLITIIL